VLHGGHVRSFNDGNAANPRDRVDDLLDEARAVRGIGPEIDDRDFVSRRVQVHSGDVGVVMAMQLISRVREQFHGAITQHGFVDEQYGNFAKHIRSFVHTQEPLSFVARAAVHLNQRSPVASNIILGTWNSGVD
jgi:hypothetical protein